MAESIRYNYKRPVTFYCERRVRFYNVLPNDFLLMAKKTPKKTKQLLVKFCCVEMQECDKREEED